MIFIVFYILSKYEKLIIIKRNLLLFCLYIKYIIVLDIYYDYVYIYGIIYYFY
jgi:hypothetical protein